jgi:hypothetical protein
MNQDDKPLTLEGMISSEHLMRAIENSLRHSGETTHGTTGLHFRNYTIIVRKKKGLSWHIECRFRPGGERVPRSQAMSPS